MSDSVKPYKESQLSKKEQVTQMFDTISNEYDGLNRVISLGIDQKWRRRVIEIVQKSGAKKVLDIATGTGDLAIMLAENTTAQITGLDLSAGMLEIGKKKVTAKNLNNRIEMLLGDSERIPFENNTFDAVTVAFGVRNFENLEQGLSEILRVLKPAGTFVILETSVPTKFPFKQGYNFHCKVVLPLIGKIFSRDNSAYSYLSESAAHFPYGERMNAILRKVGFQNVKDFPQTFGVATIYHSTK